MRPRYKPPLNRKYFHKRRKITKNDIDFQKKRNDIIRKKKMKDELKKTFYNK